MSYSNRDDDKVMYKSSDEYIKPKLFDMLIDGYDHFRKGSLPIAFNTFSAIFTIIYPREFQLKDKLVDDTETLGEYFDMANSNSRLKNEQIELGRMKQSLKKFFYQYMLDISVSMDELGLLLKTTTVSNDMHKDLSEQNFGDEMSLFSQYKKELKELSSKEILNRLSKNMIYRVYALWRYDNATKE